MLDPSQIEKLIKGETIKYTDINQRPSVFSNLQIEIAFSDIGYQRIIDIAQKGLEEING